MRPAPHPCSKVPDLDLSLLTRPEHKENLLSLLRSLPTAPDEDPISTLITVSELGLKALKRSSLTNRSYRSARYHPCEPETERKLHKMKKEISQQRRALQNYEFVLSQPEVAETVRNTLRKMHTLKCKHCHKLFNSQEFLSTHEARRHSDSSKIASKSLRKSQLATLNSVFSYQFDTLQSTVVTVNHSKSRSAHIVPSSIGSETALLRTEYSQLLADQEVILSQQAERIKEIETLQERSIAFASPPESNRESQQISLVEKQSVGEATFGPEFMRSPEEFWLEKEGKLGDIQEESKLQTASWTVNSPMLFDFVGENAQTTIPIPESRPATGRNRYHQRRYSRQISKDFSSLKSRIELLEKCDEVYSVFPDKYSSRLKSVFSHSSEEVEATKASIVAQIQTLWDGTEANIDEKRCCEFEDVRRKIEKQLSLLLDSTRKKEPITIETGENQSLHFNEGPLFSCVTLHSNNIAIEEIKATVAREADSMLSLDYENSISFSIEWSDEEEIRPESFEMDREEERRLGFFLY